MERSVVVDAATLAGPDHHDRAHPAGRGWPRAGGGPRRLDQGPLLAAVAGWGRVCAGYEVLGPGDWTRLVARYPLDVSKSRRHDWWRVTGCSGTWLVPDWAAVAADYDAVHLSTGGYLTTAGCALETRPGCTVLAVGPGRYVLAHRRAR